VHGAAGRLLRPLQQGGQTRIGRGRRPAVDPDDGERLPLRQRPAALRIRRVHPQERTVRECGLCRTGRPRHGERDSGEQDGRGAPLPRRTSCPPRGRQLPTADGHLGLEAVGHGQHDHRRSSARVRLRGRTPTVARSSGPVNASAAPPRRDPAVAGGPKRRRSTVAAQVRAEVTRRRRPRLRDSPEPVRDGT
jgi:hypothetical protein